MSIQIPYALQQPSSIDMYIIRYTAKKHIIKYLPRCCFINEIAKLIAPFINFQSWF